jgi:tetratricopeptide (TPR) repeat protein
MRMLADYHAGKGQWEQAARHYADIVDSCPDGPRAAGAKLDLARAHGARGEEEKMAALLKEVAALPPANTQYGIMDASNTRNHAHRALADYYMRKKDWQEALKWWQRWKPDSWCGTCAEAMREQREENIATCRKMLRAKPR